MNVDKIIEIAEATKTAEPGRDGWILPVAFAQAILVAEAAPRPDGMPVSPVERRLRRMLCLQRHGSAAYMDDGEAAFGGDEDCPSIDYMRMTPNQIEAIWREAGARKLARARGVTHG